MPNLNTSFSKSLQSIINPNQSPGTISEEDVVLDSLLTNVTSQTGDADFTHLNISTTAPYNSLVGYWSFDGDAEDTLTTTHYDFTKEGNDGTGVAQVNTTSTGCLTNFGNCLQLDGDEDRVNLSDDASLLLTNFTFSTWFKTSSLNEHRVLICKRTVDTDYYDYYFAINAENAIRGFVRNAGDSLSLNSSENSISADTWYHAVFSYNGTGYYLFLDGVQVAKDEVSGIVPPEYGGDALIGSNYDSTFFNGTIDELMIFNIGLAPQQILDIYNNQSARFVGTGKQELNNQSYLNLSGDYINITTTFDNNFESNLSLFLQYYESGAWSSTSPQNLTSGQNASFDIGSDFTNITLNYTLIAGNDSITTFYTPIVYGDINIWNHTIGVADTTYPLINITFPINNTDYTDTGLHINYTFVEANPDTCWYTNDTNPINVTINCGTNITTTTWSIGLHNVTIWINDSSNNVNSSYVNFSVSAVDSTAPAITNFKFIALNSSEGQIGTDEAAFNFTNLEDIEHMNISFLLNDTTGIVGDIKIYFTANGTSACSLGNNQSTTCYNFDSGTWVEFQNNTDTLTFRDVGGSAQGDSISCDYTTIANARNYTCEIDEHYNPNVWKHYPLNFSDMRWQSEINQRIKKNTVWKIELDTLNIPLDADYYKIDFRVNASIGLTPTNEIVIYLCNSTYTVGDPSDSVVPECQLVGGKLPADLTDDGTKCRDIFTNALTSNLGDIKYVLITTDSPASKYYSMKTYGFLGTAAVRTSISNDDGATYTLLADSYETELNINWFYDSTSSNITQILFKIYSNDSLNNDANSSMQIMTWDEGFLNEPPIVDIIVPEINSNNSGTLGINWTTAEPNGDSYTTNITADNGTTISIVSQLSSSISNSTWDTTAVTDGYWNLTVESCENITSDLFCGNDTHEILIDNTYPTIDIIYPTNTIYIYRTIQDLNYTFTETNPDSCWYSNDSGVLNSSTVSAGTNWTNLPVIVGSNNWTIWCNDSVDNLNSSNVTFTINAQTDLTYPLFFDLEDDNATLEDSGNATFNVSIAHSNGTVILAFNNTNYTAELLSTNISWCYQESANISTSCGGLDTGAYDNDTNWNVSQPVSNTYDEDFGTYGAAVFSSLSTMYVNYTIPPFAENTSLWNVKWGTTTENFTLEDCWNEGDVLEFRVFSHTLTETGRTSWFCWADGIGGWWALRGFTGYDDDNYKIFEEAMWWNISEETYNATVPITEPGTWEYFWISYGDGEFENYNRSPTQYYTVNVTDTEYPQFSNYWDNNGSLVENGTAEFNVTITSTNGTVWINFQGESDVIASNSTADVYNVTVYVSDTNNHQYFWSAYGNGTDNNLNNSVLRFYSANVSRVPEVNITYPTEDTIYLTLTLDLNYTVFDDLDLAWCWWNNGTVNSTKVVAGTNWTGLTATEGKNTWIVYCNDTKGNENSSIRNFKAYANTVPPNVTVNTPVHLNTYNTSIVYFNVTALDDSPGMDSCWLSWDNWVTNYTMYNTTSTDDYNYTNITMNDGNYKVKFACNDTIRNNLNNSESAEFTIDTIYPQINITYPINNTGYVDMGIPINYTRSDTNLDSCWYHNDSNPVNTTLASCTNISGVTWSLGTHNVTIWVNDSANNVNYSYVNFSISVADTTNPDVTINTPINTTYNSNSIDFNATALDETSMTNGSCWISIDSGITNLTLLNTTNNDDYNATNTTVPDGGYKTQFWCNDSTNNINNSETVNFSVDTIYPNIDIIYPPNLTNSTDFALNVNYSYFDLNVDVCWWTDDGGVTNQSSPTCQNLTGLWIEGMNNVTIYINDSANNVNSTSVSFTIDINPPDINITYPPNNTNSSDIGLNINYTISDALISVDSCWYSNDTYLTNTSLTTNCNNITTVTWTEGQHNVTVWANDSLNNINSSSVTFTIDISPPYFTVIANQTLSNTTALSYDIDAEDLYTEVDCFTVNNTGNFSITCAGVLTNATGNNPTGVYWINITVNDSLNNLNSSIMFVNYTFTVDTTPPYFITISNYTHLVNTSFTETIVADDETSFSSYSLNDTTVFDIGIATGIVTNATPLTNITIYYLNVTINDTSNNLNSSVFYINITEVVPSIIKGCTTLRVMYDNPHLPAVRRRYCGG